MNIVEQAVNKANRLAGYGERIAELDKLLTEERTLDESVRLLSKARDFRRQLIIQLEPSHLGKWAQYVEQCRNCGA